MKNIYILDEYQSSAENGIGTFLRELLKCLEGCNVRICLIEFNSNEKSFEIKDTNALKEIHFPFFEKNGFLANFKIIDKFFRLHIQDSQDNLFMLNHSPCEDLLKEIKTSFPLSKIIFTIHDFGWTSRLLGDSGKLREIICKETHRKIKEQYQPIIDYFHEEQRMYKVVDKVICLSDDTYQFLQEVYSVDKNRILLIPNGLTDACVPLSSVRKRALKVRMGIIPDEKILLVTGRVTHAKGLPSLLAAFVSVVKKYPTCRLVIVGKVYDSNSILRLSKRFAAKVSYTGLIDKEELNRWYQIADVGLVSSLSEQCSYSGIEMMMYGLPIVASDGFGVRSMFREGINAKIAEIGSRKKMKEYEANLATAILELLFSKTLSIELSAGARQMYESYYTLEKMQEGYKKLLESLDN